MEHSQSTYLVTGAASGLGRATALDLVEQGAHVVAVDLANDELDRLAEPKAGQGGLLIASAADVTSPEQVTAAIGRALALSGRLDGVVHCAGIAPAARVVGRSGPHDLDLFRKVIEVNLTGTFNVARLAAEAMSRQQADAQGARGTIVLTSSIAAFEGQVGQAAYASAKAGVAGLTLPMARELARFGIRVVCIAPGVFRTPLVESMPDAVQKSLAKEIPFPARLGEPAEFALLVRQVLENTMLNGCVIRLDGGLRMPAGA